MDGKLFIKSTALGLGAMLVPVMASCKTETEAKTETETVVTDNNETMVLSDPKIVKQSEGHKINVIGDNQNIKLSGKDTNGQFTLIEQVNEPGVGIGMHVHQNEDEIFQVLEGQLKITVGDQSTVLNPGDLGFLPRGIPHAWEVVGEQKTRALLSIFPSGLEHMFEDLSKLPQGPPDLELVAKIVGKYGVSFV